MRTIKQLILIIATCLFAVTAQAQWSVISVQGKILADGVVITQSNRLNMEQVISFTEALEAKAILADAEGAMFLLEQAKGSVNGENASLGDLIKPYKSYSTRGFRKAEDRINDLKQYMGNARFTVLGDKIELLLSEEKYPLNNNKFIVFYYEQAGEKLSKKVGFDHQKLIIENNKLLPQGNEIRNLHIYQYEISTKETNLITKVHLNFANMAKVKGELTVLKTWLTSKGMAATEANEKLTTYFEAVYGRTQPVKLLDLVAGIN